MNELTNPSALISMLEAEALQLREISEENALLKTKTQELDLVEASGDALDMQLAANMIRDHFHIKGTFGRMKLYTMLREWGVIMWEKNVAKSEYTPQRFRNVAPVRAGFHRPSVKVTTRGLKWIIEQIPKREAWRDVFALIEWEEK